MEDIILDPLSRDFPEFQAAEDLKCLFLDTDSSSTQNAADL